MQSVLLLLFYSCSLNIQCIFSLTTIPIATIFNVQKSSQSNITSIHLISMYSSKQSLWLGNFIKLLVLLYCANYASVISIIQSSYNRESAGGSKGLNGGQEPDQLTQYTMYYLYGSSMRLRTNYIIIIYTDNVAEQYCSSEECAAF